MRHAIRSTDVLFVNPADQPSIYQGLSGHITAVAPPAWAGMLAERVRKCGFRPAVHDVAVDGWGEPVAASLFRPDPPGLAVLVVAGHNPSASTQTMPAAGRIARDIKRLSPGVPVAMAGLHPSALPARTLAEEVADFVIAGEGAGTLPALLSHLAGDLPVEAVPGLWYRGAGGIASTPPPAGGPLDELLDGCAWDLLPPLSKYRAHTMHCFQRFEESGRDDFLDVRSPYATLHTSLGCPYGCDYCCISALHGGAGVRCWSVDKVVGWIDELATVHRVRNIRIEDELFLLSPGRVEAICDRLVALGHDLNLWVYGRVDTIRPALLPRLKAAGVSWICLGIESASASVLEGVGKRQAGDVRAVVRSIRDAGIHVLGNFMFGLPDDDAATMEETFRLALELRCDFVNFNTTMAYPGSALYDRRKDEGVLPHGWEGYAQLGYETRPLPTRHLTSAQVLRFRDAAFVRYFSDPGYLAMMRERFGPRVEGHLREMLRTPVRRRLLEEPS